MAYDFFGKRFFFLGICGISMSSLAEFTHIFGGKVCGSDKRYGESFDKLKTFADVKIGQNVKALLNCDVVVYSLAVPFKDSELALARRLEKKIFSRGEYLALISSSFQNTVAVTGAHGKSTVVCMLTEIFFKNGMEFSSHVGALDGLLESNCFFGGKKYFLTEACEYKKGFLYLKPSVAIITNVDFDHPDAYVDVNELKNSFRLFSEQSDRLIVAEKDFDLFENSDKEIVSLDTDEILQSGKLMGNVRIFNASKTTKSHLNPLALRYFCYKKPPRHNVLNAAFAYVAALTIGLSPISVQNALSSFRPVKRRYEKIGYINDCVVIADYAHHPNQIKGVIQDASNEYPNKKLTVVFQPHTYSRTKALLKEFSTCFKGCEKLLILPTFPARETPDMGADSETLFKYISFPKDKLYFGGTEFETYSLLKRILDKDGVCLLLGAGDVYSLKQYIK